MAGKRYRFKRERHSGRGRALAAAGILALALLGVLAWQLISYSGRIGAYPAVQGVDRSADAVVVLTGGRGRLDAGLALFKAGLAPVMFISGVDPRVSREGIRDLIPPPPEGLDDAAVDCCVALGYSARDTIGNAREVAEWITESGRHSILLVTNGYHMPRAMAEFVHALPGVEIIPAAVASPDFHLERFWAYPGTFRLVAVEWMKSGFAAVRMGLEDLLTTGAGEREG